MKRPPKPRITKPNLSWVWRSAQGVWKPYHRVTWWESGKRRERTIFLDWQGDPQKLDELYWRCAAGRDTRQAPAPSQHSWGALIVAWRSDPRIQVSLAKGTRERYGRLMNQLLEKNADKAVQNTTRQGLRAIHVALADKPRDADFYLTIVSLLWNYGLQTLDWPLGPNPALGIKKYGTQKEFLPWPDWLIAKLSDAPVDVQTVAHLILGTGQRPNAAITMRWDQFSGEWMTITDQKNNQQLEVFCPQDLKTYLETLPKRGAHIVAKNLIEPKGYSSVAGKFKRWRDSLGEPAKPFVLHGLRKLAIIRLAEAGCSDAQIQAVTNQSAEMVTYYRKHASRKILSREAQEKRT